MSVMLTKIKKKTLCFANQELYVANQILIFFGIRNAYKISFAHHTMRHTRLSYSYAANLKMLYFASQAMRQTDDKSHDTNLSTRIHFL